MRVSPRTITLLLLVIAALVVGGWWLTRYTAFGQKILQPGQQVTLNGTPTTTTTVPYKVEAFAHNLVIPWSMVFTAPNRMLVTERPGTIRAIVQGVLQPEPLFTFTDVLVVGEEGLMGMDIHPDYKENHYVYVALSYRKGSDNAIKVVRLTDEQTKLSNPVTLFDTIPGGNVHAGGRLKFGPDRKLYVTTGDTAERGKAQDRNTLHGKILRLNDDGTIPSDNPYPNSPVYSYGHRNPQGLAWHPTQGTLWSTEHGPSLFDGPAGGDEVNLIEKNGNYGWPLVSHTNNKPGLLAPKIVFTPAVAPASAMIYTSSYFPQFKHNLFFGALKGEGLFRVIIDEDDPHKVISYEKMALISVGRVRDVIEGPDGSIYLSTSNRDGRGKAGANDDTIYRLVRDE